MQVNLVTYHFVDNYGAALQAYCLQKAVEELGHTAQMVDYRPRHLTDGGGFWWPTTRWRRRANLVIGYKKALALRALVTSDGGKLAKFTAFHHDHLKIADRRYRTYAQLTAAPPDGDAFITGSDQIWNPSEQFGIDPAYFLGFARPGQKTLSYAPSFGRPSLDPMFHGQVRGLLGGLDSISVREESGGAIVRQLTGRDSAWVVDPTFLITDGHPEAIAPADQPNDYIFSYTLRSRQLVAQIEAAAAARLNHEVVSPATLKSEGREVPGPLEWLGYLKAAKFVITNSFHGTVFSVIFRKPFVFVGLNGPKAAFNERVRCLLERIGLADRMIFEGGDAKLDSLLHTEPDWEHAHAALDSWRAESFEFLRRALG